MLQCIVIFLLYSSKMKEKYTNIIECGILKFSQNFKSISKRYFSSKNIVKKNFLHLNFNEKFEVFYHNLDFMKYILLNNGKLYESHSSEYDQLNKIKNLNGKFITIILNNTLDKYTGKIISNSDIIICADGGANRLYNFCLKLKEEKNINNKQDLKERNEKNKIEIDTGKNEDVKSIYMEDFSSKSTNNSDINISEIEEKDILYKKIDKKKNDKNLKNNGECTDKNILYNKLDNIFIEPIKRNKNDLNFPLKILPDLVCGDFDSINSEVYNYYKSKSVLFERCEDQITTDLDKCINKIKGYIKENDKIIVLGATGNRFDQTCANISSLYKNISLNIYLISENNFLFLLKEGNHIVNVNLNIFEKNCGILPIGNKCKVKTEGLKYNLNYTYLSFDTIISSSNEIVQNEVKIFNESPVLWYSQLKEI
ncbi:thiamine pyrophosphokinase, putative [Plasmodium gallinaceum]|uniref:Thiamine pyrophosphokinase, putative n=1 Tax=Plasmodium gallinaceum TaxID=5849 RepID=A0A1J1GWU5_PLAGA|nr:thiamine pyrophosphokinase, putative [Plasmodium gallinaceum]CRG96790.1 thiamine pyrophosphokinase, putative [Plasmodium gallinaceum]